MQNFFDSDRPLQGQMASTSSVGTPHSRAKEFDRFRSSIAARQGCTDCIGLWFLGWGRRETECRLQQRPSLLHWQGLTPKAVQACSRVVNAGSIHIEHVFDLPVGMWSMPRSGSCSSITKIQRSHDGRRTPSCNAFLCSRSAPLPQC